MPMTQASLSTKIQVEIVAQLGAADDSAQLKRMADAIAKAVVDEVQANAQGAGTTTVVGGSSAGVHPTTIPAGGIT